MTHGGMVSRIAALGLLVGFCASLGIAVGVPLVGEYRQVLAEVERDRVALDGDERLARSEAGLRRRIESIKRDRSLDELLLPAGSESGATAAIQVRVQSIIGSAGGWLTSVQALPTAPDGDYQRVGLRVQFAADIDSLRDILYALEFGRPVMVVDNLFVHARTSRAIGVVYPLDVRVDVFTFKPGDA